MSTYILGDVQGCFDSLVRLATAIDFDPKRDELYSVGDLVNRGPKNLEVLRFFRDLGSRATVVLGNHDLHLLARVAGVAPAKRLDTLDDVLFAEDRDALADWLRHRPVVVERGRDLVVHAGFLPSWTRGEILAHATEISTALSGESWQGAIDAITARREVGVGALSAVLQRVRMIDEDERLIDYSGPPADGPAGAVPWFEPAHQRGPGRVFFGHWSALGLVLQRDVVGLDSGCVWGGTLTAYNVEAGTVTSVPCAEAAG